VAVKVRVAKLDSVNVYTRKYPKSVGEAWLRRWKILGKPSASLGSSLSSHIHHRWKSSVQTKCCKPRTIVFPNHSGVIMCTMVHLDGGNNMDITYLRIARRLWTVDYIPYWEQRANMRKWIRALRVVGDKWLLANQELRKE